METILVPGATGVIGREVVSLLVERGFRVRAYSRDMVRAGNLGLSPHEIIAGDAVRGEGIDDAVRGASAVISCLGAPVDLTLRERRGFHAIDTVANRNLVRAARGAGVQRFVYVAPHSAPGYENTAYERAHEAVVDELAASGLSFAVVRSTGLFAAFDPFIAMARRGTAAIPGDGSARTNPVAARDVAELCVEALTVDSGASLSIGGPDIVTRQRIVEMAFEAVGKTPRIHHVPATLVIIGAALLRPFHPRLSQLLDFAPRVFTHDCIAPTRGRHRLAGHFAEVAARVGLDHSSSFVMI